jgi:uncharacterized membrane protein YeiH
MTPTISLACLIVAIILFVLSAVRQIEPHQYRLQAIGLAFFAAAHLSI